MGTIRLRLPDDLSSDAREALEKACITGGPDNMPTPTTLVVDDEFLSTTRMLDESGHLSVPWEVEGFGHLMTSTATLVERDEPYSLLVELARGKVNQLRCQAEDWRLGGLQIPPLLDNEIREAGRAFGKSVTRDSREEAEEQAGRALALGFETGWKLVDEYARQVLQIRQQKQTKLSTALGCRVIPDDAGCPAALHDNPTQFLDAFNTICIPFYWKDVEPDEANFNWDRHDALLDWAEKHDLNVIGGPLIDFSAHHLPDWLWLWQGDVSTIASVVCKYVEKTIHRYHKRIRRWHLTTGSNCSSVLDLTEEEMLGLTYRILDTARQVSSTLELVIGLGQPSGEYLTDPRHHASPSPYFFVDTLLRAGVNYLTALDIEIVMGCSPRGSFCRDLMSASHVLDLYAFLGLPLHVTLGFPCGTDEDPLADPEVGAGNAAGRWRGAYDADVQAEWAAALTKLAVCKPFVQSVQWAHYSDAEPHLFPHVGLLDADGNPRPALERLKELRTLHVE